MLGKFANTVIAFKRKGTFTMINYNGNIDNGNQIGIGLAHSTIRNFSLTNRSDLEERLESLDDETKAEVMKHMDDFRTLEEMEMFIQQRTKNRDQFT